MNRSDYLARQRWFAGSEAIIDRIEPLPWIFEPFGGFGVRFELIHVTNGDRTQTYNVPASYRKELFPGLDGALMAVENGLFVYDAMLDAHARTALLSGFFSEETTAGVGGVTYDIDEALGVDARSPTILLVAEQSNTSVIVGDSLLWKLFRIVSPGHNPDIEIGRALTSTGSTEIAPVRARMSAATDAEAIDLAMVYDYYPTATDGWDSARASFRDLLADVDLRPDEAGADFAAESERLGQTVASVHRLMTDLGVHEWNSADLAALIGRLTQRFAESVRAAPELAPWAESAMAAYAEIGEIAEPVPVQRVHGDLHLGQTLRTVDGWKLFDFEGEPAKALADRARPDSVLRDVAGMLRSFDYAPRSVLMQVADQSADSGERAAQWSARNSEAFLRGYGIGPDSAAYILLRCYQIDKAAYEVAYEKEHRPGWIDIPLNALHRLLGPGG